MRVKSDARRARIIEEATAMFGTLGFERVSMSAIAARVGGSKTTLYGYFKSKEDLFVAVMLQSAQGRAEALTALLASPDDDMRTALLRFGAAYLDVVLSPDLLAATRIGIADGATSELGARIYAEGPGRGLDHMTQQLAHWIAEGRLRPADPRIAASQLRALLEAGTLEPLLYGATPTHPRDDVVAAAIDTFLRAYAARAEALESTV